MQLKPTIHSFARTQAKWEATEFIHNAILEQVTSRVSYDDMVSIETNADGEVVYMHANILFINRIASEAVLEVQRSLVKLEKVVANIPVADTVIVGPVPEKYWGWRTLDIGAQAPVLNRI